MRVDDAAKTLAGALSLGRLSQKIFILTEEHATKIRSPIQQSGIVELGGPVQLGGQDVHAAENQRPCDRSGHVNIQVEAEAHASLPSSRSLLRRGDSVA